MLDYRDKLEMLRGEQIKANFLFYGHGFRSALPRALVGIPLLERIAQAL